MPLRWSGGPCLRAGGPTRGVLRGDVWGARVARGAPVVSALSVMRGTPTRRARPRPCGSRRARRGRARSAVAGSAAVAGEAAAALEAGSKRLDVLDAAWQQASAHRPKGPEIGFAAATPLVADGVLYATFGHGVVAAMSAMGRCSGVAGSVLRTTTCAATVRGMPPHRGGWMGCSWWPGVSSWGCRLQPAR